MLTSVQTLSSPSPPLLHEVKLWGGTLDELNLGPPDAGTFKESSPGPLYTRFNEPIQGLSHSTCRVSMGLLLLLLLTVGKLGKLLLLLPPGEISTGYRSRLMPNLVASPRNPCYPAVPGFSLANPLLQRARGQVPNAI